MSACLGKSQRRKAIVITNCQIGPRLNQKSYSFDMPPQNCEMKSCKFMLPRQIEIGPATDKSCKLLQFPSRSGQMKGRIAKIAYLVHIDQFNTAKTGKAHIKF